MTQSEANHMSVQRFIFPPFFQHHDHTWIALKDLVGVIIKFYVGTLELGTVNSWLMPYIWEFLFLVKHLLQPCHVSCFWHLFCFWIVHVKTIVTMVVQVNHSIQGALVSFISSISSSLMMPASPNVQCCQLKLGFFFKILMPVFNPPSMLMKVKLSTLVAVWNAFLCNNNWHSQFKLSWLITALFHVATVIKPNSPKWFCWGVSLAVCSNWMFIHVAWLSHACSFVFSPVLSCLAIFIGFVACHHFSNWAWLGSILPLFVSWNLRPYNWFFHLHLFANCFLEWFLPHLCVWLRRYWNKFHCNQP